MTENLKRVVIWGHKPVKTLGFGRFKRSSHTHSHIHLGYFKAFSALGFETYWIDSLKDLPKPFLEQSLFFTEGQVDEDLPVNMASFYVTHHSDSEKYHSLGERWLKLHNFVMDLRDGRSYNYPGSKVQEVDDVTYFDQDNNALYQPWATDLLPGSEVNPMLPSVKIVNYVGTINHDGISGRFTKFREDAKASGYIVKVHSGVSEDEARRLMQTSALAIDFRGDWHLARGYIPCRLWKGLSYGRAMTSNSAILEGVFGSRVAFAQQDEPLFDAAVRNERSSNSASIHENAEWVMKNHTFVNRAKRILERFAATER